MSEKHPSRFDLDVLSGAEGDEIDTAVADHVAGCRQCRAIVEEVKRRQQLFLEAGQAPEAFGARIFELAAHQKAEAQLWRYRLSARVGWGVAVAAAAGLAALVILPTAPPTPSKGSGPAEDLRPRGGPRSAAPPGGDSRCGSGGGGDGRSHGVRDCVVG